MPRAAIGEVKGGHPQEHRSCHRCRAVGCRLRTPVEVGELVAAVKELVEVALDADLVRELGWFGAVAIAAGAVLRLAR